MTRSSMNKDWFLEEGARVNIVDTTLRDGEQTAGVVFTNNEKIQIARYLDMIGVDQIEAGIPVMGGFEKDCIKEIVALGLKSSIMAWNRAVIADIKSPWTAGWMLWLYPYLPRIFISSTSCKPRARMY